MGQSTDAHIGWGIAFDAEECFSYEAINAFDAELEGGPLRTVVHCSSAAPMLAIVVADSHQQAWRGNPQRVDGALQFQPTAEHVAAISRAVSRWQELLVEHGGYTPRAVAEGYPAEPVLGWYLFSDWS
jgi:hypothetical protein